MGGSLINGDDKLPDGKCEWNLNYRFKQTRGENRSHLYLQFNLTQNTCQAKSFRLDLVQIRNDNVTQCDPITKDHSGTMINETKEMSFWYTNLEPGRYCVMIELVGVRCERCLTIVTEAVQLRSKASNHLYQKGPKIKESKTTIDATVLYPVCGGIILIAVAVALVFQHRSRNLLSRPPDEPPERNSLCTCTCSRTEALTEVFLLHARDAIQRSTALCKRLQEFSRSSTLINELYNSQFTPAWIQQKLKTGKVIVVESERSFQIYQKHTERIRNIPHRSSVEELHYLDDVFQQGLSYVDTFLNQDYSNVFVVRFPPTSDRNILMESIQQDKRFRLPEKFPDLCRHLICDSKCESCLRTLAEKWRTIANSADFVLDVSTEQIRTVACRV